MNTPGIGTTRLIPTTDLHLHHKNPRRGDVDAIAGSLQAHGQFRPIVVNEGTHTGRPLEVVAGNHTLKAIRQLAETNPDDPRWSQVEAYVIDVDEDRATKIVLADNRTSDLGSYDDTALLDLLDSVDHDLEGTGYTDDDLTMLHDMADNGIDFDELNINATSPRNDDGEEGDDEDGSDAEPLTDEEYAEQIEEYHEKYTHAATAPTYTPQDDTPPPLDELIDTTKTERLLTLINSAEGIPPEVKELLRVTAHRHTVINFKKIAEWYAHQPGEIQELAEQQALVIIDLKDALREGYATLTGELRRYALEESGYDDSDPDPANRNPHLELTEEDEAIRERARARAGDTAMGDEL